MKVLADLYKGAVQFAYVDAIKYRNLGLAFGVRKLPTSFLYRNGVWIETRFGRIAFKSLRTFIDGYFLDKKRVHNWFETPTWVLPRWLGPAIEHYYKLEEYWETNVRPQTIEYLRTTPV